MLKNNKSTVVLMRIAKKNTFEIVKELASQYNQRLGIKNHIFYVHL
jgi:hypothetical protein